MIQQIIHLEPVILAALNSPRLPATAPLRQAGFTAPDIRRACRLLEEQMAQRLGGGLSIEAYNESVTRWHRNRDHLCKRCE